MENSTVMLISTELEKYGFSRSTKPYSKTYTKLRSYQKVNEDGEKIRVMFKDISFRIEKHNGKKWKNMSNETFYLSKYESGLNGNSLNLLKELNCI